MPNSNYNSQKKSKDSLHKKGLAGLFSISKTLASGLPQKRMLAEVLEIMDHELSMQRGTIMLVTPDGTEIVAEVAQNISKTKQQTARYRFGEGIVGKVIESNTPAVIPKISEEPEFIDRLDRLPKHANQELSFICVPISTGHESVGALSADRPYKADAPLDEILEIMTIIASMIANDVRRRRLSAISQKRLEEENTRLKEQLETKFRPENIIGNSGAMREVYKQIHQVAATDTTVLIRGESGTGKELVAHAIHYLSERAKRPFVKVNCAALSENLLESELFGHEKGAFTGATQTRQGRIEEANGGTLFLDEIGDFSPTVQVKLLRVLQEREFERVGSSRTQKANVRIICATHRNLEKQVKIREFRQDLYYRINVFGIKMPPLRERKDDIILLADHFCEKYASRMHKDIRRISTPAINMMTIYHWPGNVRELENCIERAVLLSTDGVIHAYHMPPSLQTAEGSDTIGSGTLKEQLELHERDIIVDALKFTAGNVAGAARNLGTTQRILGYRAKKLGIDFRNFRSTSKHKNK